MGYGLAYVPEDRHEQGLILDFSIAANISLPVLGRLSRLLGVISRGREAARRSGELHPGSGMEPWVAPSAGPTPQHNLPEPMTSFVGRER